MDEKLSPVETLRQDIETLKKRKRLLEAGEMPFVDAPDGEPPSNYDFKRDIAQTEEKIADLYEQLRKLEADRT